MDLGDATPSEICGLLRQVQGIRSVEPLQGTKGDLEGVEITVAAGALEKRVIRDVESALLSGLGLRLDHRAIHVRPGLDRSDTVSKEAEPVVLRHLEPLGLAASASAKSLSAHLLLPQERVGQRIRLENLWCEVDGRHHCEVTVVLGLESDTVPSSVREVDTPRGRIHAAGRATVQGIEQLAKEEVAISLEGVEQFPTWEATGMLALLRVRQGRSYKDCCGAALVDDDPLEATARAVLDASNRFLESSSRSRPVTLEKG